MGKVIKVDFEKNSLSDEERFKEEVQPILQDLVDVARHNFGNITAIDMLSDIMGVLYKYTNEETYILTMENGDIIDFTLDTIG
mgnify:FL=1|jgi:hypothetical protein|tara:strand:- start:422 stop:670 length:249 start_codon:yes stop_codon:yes gene_type:complete